MELIELADNNEIECGVKILNLIEEYSFSNIEINDQSSSFNQIVL